MNCKLILLSMLVTIQALAGASDSTRKGQPVRPIVQIAAVPVLLVAAGLYTEGSGHLLSRYDVRSWRNDHYGSFKTHVDDYLQYAPALAALAVGLTPKGTRNDWPNKLLLLAKSELLMTTISTSLKYATHIERPDGSNFHSFPSGHTAQAFVAATFMQKELRHRSVWYSVGAYTAASAVGAMRVLNNKHWISDVLTGAGIGILSANLVYATHQYRWGKRPAGQTTLLPTWNQGPGLYFCYRF